MSFPSVPTHNPAQQQPVPAKTFSAGASPPLAPLPQLGASNKVVRETGRYANASALRVERNELAGRTRDRKKAEKLAKARKIQQMRANMEQMQQQAAQKEEARQAEHEAFDEKIEQIEEEFEETHNEFTNLEAELNS
eukprot:Sro160_g072090.1 n/a (137) ;mRNA; r:27834-28244